MTSLLPADERPSCGAPDLGPPPYARPVLKSMSGTRDAWPTRLVVISGALLVAVLFEAVASVVAALALPSGGWMSISTIISPAPGTSASSAPGAPPHITTLPAQNSSIHEQLAVGSQWAAPVQGMLIPGRGCPGRATSWAPPMPPAIGR